MNGKALGLTPVADGDAGDGQFTANDRNADWDRTGATQITLTGDGGSVKGGGAYISDGDVHILYAGTYILSGELSDGSVIIEADRGDKIWVLLNGVSLHCNDGAAILVEQAEKVFLTLADGTENSVSSGAEYNPDAVSTGIDGAIYARDDLTINGGGSLCVTAEYRHAIVCNDDLVVAGGTLEVTAPQDGIHANDSARFSQAAVTINAGDDGITVSNDEETGYAYVESGRISIPSCYEGIEAVNVTIAGGTLDIRPTDDGINASGRGENSKIHISGGDITIINEQGRDADGLDSNGDIEISGGRLFISVNAAGSNAAIDCGSEIGGTCTISGGTVIAAGSSAMAEGFDSSSEQCFIMYAVSTAPAGTTVTLKNAAGSVLLSETVPCSFSSVVLSTPELQMGETCTISVGGTENELVVDNSTSGGFGMAGMFGGGMQRGGIFGGRGDGRGDRPFGGQPDGGSADLEAAPPEIPDGDPGRDEMRGMPDGEAQRGELPGRQLPDADHIPDAPASGDMDGAALPDGFPVPGGNRGDDGRFAQWGQNRDGPQDAAASGLPAASPAAPALVGVSVLFLLAGIGIAFKIKH